MDRREFLKLLAVTGCAISPEAVHGVASMQSLTSAENEFYALPGFGNVRLLHLTDCHAQLLPIYYREPDTNIGVAAGAGRIPHIVGERLLQYLGISRKSRKAHAFTHIDFVAAAETFGKVGGFSYLKTLTDRLRSEYPGGRANTLLLDGGDTWQGSATALWSAGRDMVSGSNLLGVDVMTGHWEFTYGDETVLDNIARFKGDFTAHNIKVKDEALFEGVPAFDEDAGYAFPPFVIKSVGGVSIAVIGQAFPYTPIAHPERFTPNWTFGIQERELQSLVELLRNKKKINVIVLLSHNGMDVDLKLARNVSGIDIILGGHTHDGVPLAIQVDNRLGRTIVTNAGSNGKYLGVMDIKANNQGLVDYQYTLLPVFSNLLDPDTQMETLIENYRAPYHEKLNEVLATTETLLYRRGNFNGTFDQLICDSQLEVQDAEIAFSPGFRWGTTILPGEPITMERLLDQTGMTYPATYTREFTGNELKGMLEDIADNLFNPDPYYQQGGDMVRTAGLTYTCNPSAGFGSRISNLTLDNGKEVRPDKKYKVSGWASKDLNVSGQPIWDVVAEYLRDKQTVRINEVNIPVLKNVDSNFGVNRQ